MLNTKLKENICRLGVSKQRQFMFKITQHNEVNLYTFYSTVYKNILSLSERCKQNKNILANDQIESKSNPDDSVITREN